MAKPESGTADQKRVRLWPDDSVGSVKTLSGAPGLVGGFVVAPGLLMLSGPLPRELTAATRKVYCVEGWRPTTRQYGVASSVYSRGPPLAVKMGEKSPGLSPWLLCQDRNIQPVRQKQQQRRGGLAVCVIMYLVIFSPLSSGGVHRNVSSRTPTLSIDNCVGVFGTATSHGKCPMEDSPQLNSRMWACGNKSCQD
jgi:hypothetical protein